MGGPLVSRAGEGALGAGSGVRGAERQAGTPEALLGAVPLQFAGNSCLSVIAVIAHRARP